VKIARKCRKSDAASIVVTDRLGNRACRKYPQAYVFCEKKTGAVKFKVDVERNHAPPLDRVAGSLAVYCVAHFCSPSDLVLVLHAEEALNENIRARAVALLESAHVGGRPVALTPREREVLRAVTSNLGNKEIAFQLAISVRTVKFHVSKLLGKFGVQTRSQLSEFSTARMYDANHAVTRVL
jgi:DNA-binding CsgD family transcriptional regulator